MEFKKILITGAAGFIGSHVYDHFSYLYPEADILILDKMTYAGNIKNIPSCLTNPKHKLVVGDLIDFDLCIDATRNCDLVIHLAAESHVDNSFQNSIIFSRSNELGTHTLMEACRQNKVKKIIHVSTDEVYGENIDKPFTELDPLNPTNPYAASKAAAEMIVKSYHTSFRLPVIIVRANNIYGIRQYPEKIIPKFLVRAHQNLPLEIQGDGSNRRHYLSAIDFSEALGLLSLQAPIGEIYNIASNEELTNLEVANLIQSHFPAKNIEIVFKENRPFNDSRYYVNDSKLRLLGWAPKNNIFDDLKVIKDWYIANDTWF
jgi:UDP-glucose 4,6-dehydratase